MPRPTFADPKTGKIYVQSPHCFKLGHPDVPRGNGYAWFCDGEEYRCAVLWFDKEQDDRANN